MTEDTSISFEPTDGELALSVALEWLRAQDWTDEFGASGLKPLDVTGATGTLAERLATAGLRDWRDAIIAAAEPGQPIHLDSRLAWLMRRAAIEVAVAIDRPGVFQAVDILQMLGDVDDVTLASEFCSRIVEAAEDQLLTRLRTRLQMRWDSYVYERYRKYSEATAGSPLTTRALWPGSNTMSIDDGWAHRAAAILRPDRYMEMLANFPTVFQHGFGDTLFPLDPGLVASLVRTSPDVFSADGTPIGPVVVFALLETLEAYFERTYASAADTAGTELAEVLDSVFSRSDGDWIGRAWLQQIVWRGAPRRRGRQQADVDARRTVRDTLLVQLSIRIKPLGATFFDWAGKEEPLWVVHRVLSEALILDAHDNAPAAANVLAGAITQGLICSTGRAEGLDQNSPETVIVSRVLSQLPDLAQWFEALWRDTYQQREHLSYFAHHGLDNPAYPVLAWSLIGLNSSRATTDNTAALWCAIGAAVLETQRTDPNASLPNGALSTIAIVTVQLGAALAKQGLLPISDFANFMAGQIEPTVTHARLWQVARSVASDDLTLAAGRLVGAELLREAIKTALDQNHPGWNALLDAPTRSDLDDFSNRLQAIE